MFLNHFIQAVCIETHVGLYVHNVCFIIIIILTNAGMFQAFF